MERLKINVVLDEEALENRKYVFDKLKEDKRVIKFLSDHKLDEDFLNDNVQAFDDWIDQLNLSEKCTSLEDCLMPTKGYYFNLVYDGILHKVLTPCQHQIDYDNSRRFLKNYIVKDFPDSLVNVEIKSILQSDESLEYKNLVAGVARFLDNPKGPGYYIYGDVGVGKTYLMSAITNELAKTNKKIAFTHTPTLANTLRSIISERGSLDHMLYDLKNVDILVLDDIGTESVTNWFRDDILLSILNFRMEASKSTFFTSNLNFDELLDYYSINNKGEYSQLSAVRLLERIKSLSVPINLVGKNRRNLIVPM